jgi:adrenodoxin-NADP+ reductase
MVASSDAWKIAIVGSGPSGFYTAKYLQQSTAMNLSTRVDIFERLPTPYGLVRNGVAPDHPEVKNVQNDFQELFTMKSNKKDDNNSDKSYGVVQFWGNVRVGRDVSLYELRQRYDAVVLAFGCESDRSLSIPGSDDHLKKYILTARQFVNWYNGHPEFEWVGNVVQEALHNNSSSNNNNNNDHQSGPQQHIVVIGHGNVALDCARILAKSRHELDPTDLTTRALNILHPQNNSNNNNNTTKHISIVGRRGHIQGAFTIKEVRELTKLAPSANFVVRMDELEAGGSTMASQSELEQSRPKQRIDQLLRDNATVMATIQDNDDADASSVANNNDDNNNSTINQVHLRFLLNPIRFESKPNQPEALGAVVCERTQLQGEVGKQIAVGTGVEESLPADLCLVSIGYKGIPIDGTENYYDDKKGILKNVRGVVDNSTCEDDDGLAPLYVSGWLKRGPSGIIGTNIADAKETVASIVHDLQQRTPKRVMDDMPSLQQLLNDRKVQVVDWKSYLRINEKETSTEHLRNPQQPREKLTDWQELLEAAKE